MKKRSRLLAALLAACALLPACGGGSAPAGEESGSGKLRVVATNFPEYDWVREIVGDLTDEVEVTLLLGSGVDLHSYQPTARDIVTISDCDLFVYLGGPSESWVDGALESTAKEGRKVISLMDALGDAVKEEELTEGMGEEDGEEEEGPEYDEHIWLSLKNAQVLCDALARALEELDPAHGAAYAANAASYGERLAQLDEAYRQTVDAAARKTLLFGDRYPFRYLAEDYGLTCYAAFPGCSAETEASFETVVFLAGKVDELDLPCILTIEGSDGKLARTIAANTAKGDCKILTLNSMQSSLPEGATYLSVMEEDLAVLKEALN